MSSNLGGGEEKRKVNALLSQDARMEAVEVG